MSWIDEATTQMQRWVQPTPLRPSWGVAAGSPSIEDDATLSFHPSDLSLKQAPEKSLTAKEVTSIASARRLAESQGVLTPELGEYLLPLAMIEGWGPTMGVRNDNAFYASTRFKKMMGQMGLKKEDYTLTKIKGEPHIYPIVTTENGPRWAATVLGEKSRLKGVVTTEDAVKRYNGKGTATEYMGYDNTEPVPANVGVYWKKIQKAQELLEHPKNSSIYNHFNSEYGRLRSYLAPGK